MSKLLSAIQLPSAIAVIHCKAHQKDNSQVTKGNQYADLTAKWVATQPLPINTIAPAVNTEIPYKDFLEEGEAEQWGRKFEAVYREGFWRVSDGSPIAPCHLLQLICQRLHSKYHCLSQAIVDAIGGLVCARSI